MRSLIVVALLVTLAHAATVDEWKNRTIYQLLTDRFATDQDTCNDGSCPYGNFCGGSYKALIGKLDYIQGMGFDAVWISPVVTNTDCGYHGYWAGNLFQMNPHFGSEQDLAALSAALHARSMLLMVDVVYNHMGPTDESQLQPFNDSSYYHDNCQIDYTSQTSIEQCWLANLPDLKQEDSRVSSVLLDWTDQLLNQYNVDGIRIDTVAYVGKSFWQQLTKTALNGTYAVGEVLIGDKPLSYIAGYQYSEDSEAQGTVLDAVLNYPLFFSLRDAFMSTSGNGMAALAAQLQSEQSTFHDYSALGTFLDNHDQPRFLLAQQDRILYQNALSCTLMLPGVPIVYYGTEQAMAGGQSDNDKRQPLWSNGGYNTQSDMYVFVAALVAARKKMLAAGSTEQFQVLLSDDGNKLFGFQRGEAVVLASAAGQNGGDQHATLQASSLPQGFQPDGTQVCDVLQQQQQCWSVSGGVLNVVLSGAKPVVLFKK